MFKRIILIVVSFLMLASNVYAKEMALCNHNALQVAEEKLEMLKKSDFETWGDFEIVQEDKLFGLENNLVGYVYSLKGKNKDGYLLVHKGTDDNYAFLEGSAECKNPYYDTAGKSVYLGLLEYYEYSNGVFTDVSTNETMRKSDLVDSVSRSDIDKMTQENASKYSIHDPATEYFDWVFLPGIVDPCDFPCMNQLGVSKSHCSPTSAADIVRYANLYLDLKFNDMIFYGNTTYGKKYNGHNINEMEGDCGIPGYNLMISVMGDEMKTVPGRDVATYGDDVASGLENFLKNYTNYTAWVKYMLNNGSKQSKLTYNDFKSYIDAGYPVMLTLGSNMATLHPQNRRHTVAAFGYVINEKIIYVSDPYMDGDYIKNNKGRKIIDYNYIEKNASTIYAAYRVCFNY